MIFEMCIHKDQFLVTLSFENFILFKYENMIRETNYLYCSKGDTNIVTGLRGTYGQTVCVPCITGHWSLTIYKTTRL